MPYILPQQEKDLAAIVSNFDGFLDRAIADYAKLKEGLKRNLFTRDQRHQAVEWFANFPRYWKTIEPNFQVEAGAMYSAHRANTWRKATAFVKKLEGDTELKTDLGIGPLIIAGILIAAAFGIAGAMWAIGYYKEQVKISNLIDGVVAGKIPPEILADAIKKENEGGFFDDIGGLVKWAAIGAALIILGPPLVSAFTGRKGTSA